jgi:pyridoxamine 5'-phosphate oxidase-like protein
MGKFYTEITPELKEFIAEQQMFFTATAAATGRINLSPKGIDTLRQLDDNTVAYLDLTGSGNETAALLEVDGRMTIMFCSFAGKPWILRLYGKGEVVQLDSERGRALHPLFGSMPGERHIIVLHVESAQTSCGMAVPLYEYKEQRDLLIDWAAKKGPDGMKEYRRAKNAVSIDGLPTGLVD